MGDETDTTVEVLVVVSQNSYLESTFSVGYSLI